MRAFRTRGERIISPRSQQRGFRYTLHKRRHERKSKRRVEVVQNKIEFYTLRTLHLHIRLPTPLSLPTRMYTDAGASHVPQSHPWVLQAINQEK